MSETTEDILAGTVCMCCMTLLISDSGEPCQADHPVFCEACWDDLSKKEQDDGPPFFDEATGTVLTGMQ